MRRDAGTRRGDRRPPWWVVAIAAVAVAVSGSGVPATAAEDRPTSSAGSPSPGVGSAVAAGFRLPLPPPPVVLGAFDPPDRPWGSGHRGVDLAAAPGEVVRAAQSGTVVYAGRLVDRGVVSIRHTESLRTTYEPVAPMVHAGEVVAAGQPIGTVRPGHRRCRPASCLHWGARIGEDDYLNPLRLLGPLPVRLKPWSADQ